VLLCFALLLITSLAAVSHQSLWIDELSTAHFACQPSLGAVWHEMLRLRWPEIQAPLYMVYIWAWVQTFGAGEWVIRLAGIPWFVTGALLFVSSWRGRQERCFACLAVMVNPFIWYYLDEARLYSMQLGFTLALVAAVIRLKTESSNEGAARLKWLTLFCLAGVVLSALNVLGMIWASAAWLLLPVLFPTKTLVKWVRACWPLALATAVVLSGCALYYMWTRTLHIAPTLSHTDWRTLCFVGYELLGFNGIGPGRLALREDGLVALKHWWPGLACYGLAISVVLVAGLFAFVRGHGWRRLVLMGLPLALPAGLLITMGLGSNFRLLGRHFAPVSAGFACFTGLGALTLWRSRTWLSRSAVVLFVAISILSCLNQRFSERHAKDDYRHAAAIAKACLLSGEHVWWNADLFGTEYYHVPASEEATSGAQVWIIIRPPVGFEQTVVLPDTVIASAKLDVYDRVGALHSFLERHNYIAFEKLPAFVVFKKGDWATNKVAVSVEAHQ
jgi:hypothetical protein